MSGILNKSFEPAAAAQAIARSIGAGPSLVLDLVRRVRARGERRRQDAVVARFKGTKRWFSCGTLTVASPENVTVGDWVTMAGSVSLYAQAGISIGSGVVFGDGDILLSRNHEYAAVDAVPYATPYQTAGIVVEDGVSFGVRAIVCPGVRIGEHAHVGAGAVVTAHVAPGTIVMGNPARPCGKRDWEAYQFTKRHGRPISQIRTGALFDRRRALAGARAALDRIFDAEGAVFDSAGPLARYGMWNAAVLYEYSQGRAGAVFCLTLRGYAVVRRELLAATLRHLQGGGAGPPSPARVRDEVGVNLSVAQVGELFTSPVLPGAQRVEVLLGIRAAAARTA